MTVIDIGTVVSKHTNFCTLLTSFILAILYKYPNSSPYYNYVHDKKKYRIHLGSKIKSTNIQQRAYYTLSTFILLE